MTWSYLPIALAALGACLPEAAPPPSGSPTDEWDDRLAERDIDYNAALRIAALRLTGDLPTLVEIEQVATATGDATQRAAYETLVRAYLERPTFTRQMIAFAKDALRIGDMPDRPDFDAAPLFFAQVVVDNRSYLDLVTASTGTCPTYNATTNRFTPANCTNGGPTVGLLTHPAIHAHFFGNMAFRRVRWMQETFACTAFPAELAETAADVGGASPYTGTFPFASIAGAASGGRVDFLSLESVTCANCHSNINHVAPLFAHYDANGTYSTDFAVPVPLPGDPTVQMSDYLPAGESMAWRFGVPVADMPALGRAMAADDAIAECAVARVWNWAMGKPDIVDGAARVPSATIDAHVAAFIAGGYKLRDAIVRVFTSDDFVRF